MKKASITDIKNNTLVLQINQDSMCAHCGQNSSCMLKDSCQKQIEINVKNPSLYKIGQELEIELNSNASFYALFFAYMLPLVFLLGAFLGFKLLNFEEITCGIFAIICLIPYYLMLWFFREKISGKIEFYINDNN